MARPLRIEYSGAIYHLMARGNARQAIFHDDIDYQSMLEGVEDTVVRCGWELFSFVFMPNHIHLFLRTPQANLSRGMQRLLSAYASRFSRRHQCPGHLFQGRFKGELIEDERYFWEVSRYIHLNPVRGKLPLVNHPREWLWSSYRGYADKRRRLSWVAHDLLIAAWSNRSGSSDPAADYRKYVEFGLESPPNNPFAQSAHGFLLGGQTFVDKIRQEMKHPRFADEVPRARLLKSVQPDSVFATVAEYYNVDQDVFSERGSTHIARAVAAWIARRLTVATLRELSVPLGLGRPESVSNLTRRIDRDVAKNAQLRHDLGEIEERLLRETKNKV